MGGDRGRNAQTNNSNKTADIIQMLSMLCEANKDLSYEIWWGQRIVEHRNTENIDNNNNLKKHST